MSWIFKQTKFQISVNLNSRTTPPIKFRKIFRRWHLQNSRTASGQSLFYGNRVFSYHNGQFAVDFAYCWADYCSRTTTASIDATKTVDNIWHQKCQRFTSWLLWATNVQLHSPLRLISMYIDIYLSETTRCNGALWDVWHKQKSIK